MAFGKSPVAIIRFPTYIFRCPFEIIKSTASYRIPYRIGWEKESFASVLIKKGKCGYSRVGFKFIWGSKMRALLCNKVGSQNILTHDHIDGGGERF